jgi:putative ABC transport system permease protein
MIFTPLGVEGEETGGRLFQAERMPDPLTEIVVKINGAENVFTAASIIERILQIQHGGVKDYQLVIPLELLKQSRETRRIFNVVLGAIAGISLLVGGIGIMNIMLASVSERTREIGIRRAVGARRKDIVFQFLAEAVILTFTGGVAGIVVGTADIWLIASYAGWKTAVTPFSIVLPIVMSILVGVFFGLYPAYKASLLNPIVALRYE